MRKMWTFDVDYVLYTNNHRLIVVNICYITLFLLECLNCDSKFQTSFTENIYFIAFFSFYSNLLNYFVQKIYK